MYPLLRFDTRLPLKPWHRWQHVYIWVAYPFMHAAFQLGDFSALATNRTVGAELLGATWGGELNCSRGREQQQQGDNGSRGVCASARVSTHDLLYVTKV